MSLLCSALSVIASTYFEVLDMVLVRLFSEWLEVFRVHVEL